MISIIVSSYKQEKYNQLQENIQATIGDIPYEMIQIWNPGKMGMCEAYNTGAAKAQYPYLVFCHEDILFYTQNWGAQIIRTFESDLHIGLIGCLGSKYKNYFLGEARGFSAHYIHHTDDLFLTNIIFRDQVIMPPSPPLIGNIKSESKIVYEDVAILDGMFLVTNREVFKKIQFDPSTLGGFHAYDMDYSLAVNRLGYKVVVTHNILIEHQSYGNYTLSYFNAFLTFAHKWRNYLPYTVTEYADKDKLEFEYEGIIEILRKAKPYPKIMFSYIIPSFLSIRYIQKLKLKNWLILLFRMQKFMLAHLLFRKQK